MQTLKTVEAYGLNIADSVQLAHTLFCLFIYYYFQSTITFIVHYFYSSLDLFFVHLFIIIIFFIIIIVIIINLIFFATIYLVIIYNQFMGNACSKLRVEALVQSVSSLKQAIGTPDSDVVLVSLLLALNIFCAYYGASAVDFEQIKSVLIQFVLSRTFNYY